MEFAGSHTLEELLQAILNEAEALTNSNIGFYHFLQADQETISLQAWSTNTLRNMCTAEGKGLHYSVSAAGVWIDCIRERRAVIHNDYSALAHRKGLPPGHAPVARELVVPVFRANQIVAILGVGNKPYIYDEKDVSTVSLLADLAWDIADRKLSEQALAESEARFRQLYDEAPVAMYASNRGGEVVSINNKCLQELGRNREEVLGRPAEIFLSPDSMKRLPKVREAFWSEGRASNLSLQIVRKDGSTRDVIADSVALDDPCWGQVGFTVFRDITEQKLAEEALTQSEEFLRLIFANMNSGLLVLNCRQEIVLANDYARSCLAITDEMQDKPLLEILSNVEPLLTDAYPWEQRQIIITTPDGSRKVVAFNSTAAPDKDLRIVLFRDITMLLDNDERRKRAEQLAVVGELAAKLSHDIKNPLSSVFLGLQTLRKTESLSEDNRLTLDLVLEEVERLSENIRHVLEAARPLELSPSFLPLGEFLGWCFRIHSLTASNRGIQYELVPGPPDMFVMADETALRRIMTNLIQNAFDACGAGDHVRIGWRPIGDREKQTLAPEFPGSIVAIFVEDDGLAIPEDLQASALFRPFFTTKELGTGLGLAVVSDLVERHGGSIRLHSAGGLTLFEVLLPMGDRVPCWESLCTNACVPPNGEKDCANCEVRAQNAGLFCWVIRGRAVRAETGLWPNSCLTCPVFRATNLSYSFRGDIPTAEE
ncbi:MAG: GAF domain-containing protein, partial [Desulfomonile tiedjei]|nr:GAF domain-containing protein [Desulfomonile tiedjei]